MRRDSNSITPSATTDLPLRGSIPAMYKPRVISYS
jgi:hypothetical protein